MIDKCFDPSTGVEKAKQLIAALNDVGEPGILNGALQAAIIGQANAMDDEEVKTPWRSLPENYVDNKPQCNTFKMELEHLINTHSRENESNTPDFVLAKYLEGCLEVYELATKARDKWYGLNLKPTHSEEQQ